MGRPVEEKIKGEKAGAGRALQTDSYPCAPSQASGDIESERLVTSISRIKGVYSDPINPSGAKIPHPYPELVVRRQIPDTDGDR